MRPNAAGLAAVNGSESIQRYFQVMQGCARAAQLGLERQLMM